MTPTQALRPELASMFALAAGIGDELESLEINPLYVRGAQVEALDVTVSWTRR
jgi:hypothetical protein